jgi:hypothetical protein
MCVNTKIRSHTIAVYELIRSYTIAFYLVIVACAIAYDRIGSYSKICIWSYFGTSNILYDGKTFDCIHYDCISSLTCAGSVYRAFLSHTSVLRYVQFLSYYCLVAPQMSAWLILKYSFSYKHIIILVVSRQPHPQNIFQGDFTHPFGNQNVLYY